MERPLADTVTGVVQEKNTRRSGRFWLPESRERTVGGWLDLSGRRPLLYLADPLIPEMQVRSRGVSADGTPYVIKEPTDQIQASDNVVIQGMLRSPSRRVTLVGASSAGMEQVIGGVVPDLGEQRFRAEYMLVGPHQSGAEATFTMARLRLRHLDSWANLPGIQLDLAEDWSQVAARYERHEEEAVRVADRAELTLDAVITLNEPDVHGAGFKRSAELRLHEPGGNTVDRWWRRFVAPVTELLTMAVGVPCPPVELKLFREDDGEWVDVMHPLLVEPSESPLRAYEIFLTRDGLTLDHIGRWLEVCATLSPIPALVSEAVISPGRPLPIQLLEMAAAAEGLHRRLRPRERVISRSKKDGARRCARDAVPEELRTRVNEALMHMDEPSYAERLRYLTDLTREAIPNIAGLSAIEGATGPETRSEWEQRIKDVRKGFAHQVPRGATANDRDEWREQVILLRTLYWVVSTALLLETGIKAAQVRARAESYPSHQDLLRRARSWMPAIYDPSTVETTASEPLSADPTQ